METKVSKSKSRCASFSVFVLGVCAAIFLPALPTQAQNADDAAQFLPASTAIYVHAADPAKLIETIETHPVVNYALELKPVQQLMRTPQFAMFLLGKGLFESNIEETAIEALKTNAAKGVWLTVDRKGGAVLLFHSKDEARLKRVVGQALKLAETSSGGNLKIKKRAYRDAVAAELDNDVVIGRYKSWFAVANKGEYLKEIVDNMHDGAADPLAEQQWFKDASAKRKGADLWAAVDLETIRKTVDDKTLFLGETDNPGVELIMGGILDALKHSPVAIGELNIDDHVQFTLSAPFKPEWVHDARDYFFGENLDGRAPLSLKPKNMIANLTSYRDIGQWWLSKEDLYPERVIAELAQADSQLSTIFSGMDFGEDVLGALEPGVQIVVAENKFDPKYVPDVKLPAFALVGRLKNPEKMTRKIKIAFQSVIGFANIALGQSGQPQLDVETEKVDGAKLMNASYFYEEGTEEGLILFNFGPTIAFKGPNLILSSTREFAVELVGLVEGTRKHETANTLLSIDGQMLHKILGDNAESLIAQNMLEEGNSREEAQSQIAVILLVADLFKDAKLDYNISSQQMKADLLLRFDDVKAGAK